MAMMAHHYQIQDMGVISSQQYLVCISLSDPLLLRKDCEVHE